MGLAPLNINCPHCNRHTHVYREGIIHCEDCGKPWQVSVRSESVGFQELRVEWPEGDKVRGKPVYHHIITTRPAPPPAPAPRLVKDGEPPRPFVRPLESPALYAQRMGRVRRLPEGDMTKPGYDTALPGYDRKAARNKAVQRSELRWVGVAFVAVIVVARFVTAHDFGSFVGDMLTLALGAAIGLAFFNPDER